MIRTTQSGHFAFIFLQRRDHLLIKETYKPYTLVGPTVTRPVQDPLAVVLLDNLLYIHASLLAMHDIKRLLNHTHSNNHTPNQ